MSKERLEEIKGRYLRGLYIGGRLVGKQVFADDMTWLIEQAELREDQVQRNLQALENINVLEGIYDRLESENQRYKQALELVEDELEYAKTTGNDEVRDMYIKNSIRFINEALEGEE